MLKRHVIVIEEHEVEKIQEAFYHVQAFDLITNPNDLVKKIRQEHFDKYTKIANEIIREYIVIKKNQVVKDWSLDFGTYEMTIMVE